jgi:alginate O-acetyltransferase complex protein AlgJ
MIKATKDKIYSAIFSTLFFAILLLQLLGPNMRINKISDRFLWRMSMIRNINAFRYVIGDKVFNNGLVGKDGWLYYLGDFSINDYQKTALMGPNRLKDLAEILISLNESITRNGGVLWVIIPPDKNTIYPQYMPEQIPVIGQTSRLDQITEYLQEKTEVNILDLRPVFAYASQSSQLYYKADAHWNCLGAYYASNELISKVSLLRPEVQPHPLSDFQIGSTTDSSLDISAVMGLAFQEDTVTLAPKFPIGSISHAPYEKNNSMKVAVNSQADLPSAMVIHDSFYTECLNQFLEPQFSQIISSHYETAMMSDYIELIDTERPDVVIVEFAERHIEYFFKLMTRENE